MYVDGVLYQTVGTPARLPDSAPAGSFDIIYKSGMYQSHNVAAAAPGDPGFNGDRWEVHGIQIDDYESTLAMVDTNHSDNLDSDEEILVHRFNQVDGFRRFSVNEFVCLGSGRDATCRVPGRPFK